MKRKVIKLAANTYVVSLPSAWVQKYTIEKGDELIAEVDQDVISFSTRAQVAGPKSITVDISGSSEAFVNSLVSVLHKSGYDEVELLAHDSKPLKIAASRIEQCIGFEVVQSSEQRLVIKNVAGDDASKLDALVRRTFLVTLELASGVLEYYEKSQGAVEDLFKLEVLNNRLSNYCHRLLNKQSRGARTIYLYAISWILESIADEYRDLLKSTKSLCDVQLLGLINGHLRGLYEFVYTGDYARMDKLRVENAKLLEMIRSSNCDGKEFLLSIVKRCYDCFGSATGLVLLERT